MREFKVQDEDGTETFKFYYGLKRNEDSVDTVYIIDEASMVSNVYSEGEFFRFGSGYLLKDLIDYINFDNNDHKKKIIFIGDTAQLPPVNMNFSPALDNGYLKNNFYVETTEFELTDVVRQKSDSGILTNATNLRESLKINIFNHLDINTNFSDITRLQHEDFLKAYLNACNNQIDDETIVVAYSNASVKEYNDFIRDHFFPMQSSIVSGDKVILVANNYNYPEMELLNGDFGIVKLVNHANETRAIKIKTKSKLGVVSETNVTLSFRDAVITFTDEDGIKHDISCKIIENLLNSNKPDLTVNELKAIYIDFKIRNKNLIPGTKPFKDALRSDKYFNALRIKFGYAITCHKAQGGEWKNTFLNCKTSMGYFNASYFRWLYTGITRAKESLYTLDEPHFTVGSQIQLPKAGQLTLRQNMINLSDEMLEYEIPFELSDQKPIIKGIYLTVNDIIKDAGLLISTIRHTDYLEHYGFSQGKESVLLKIHYNSQNKITKVEKPGLTNSFTESIYNSLKQLENKTIVLPEQEQGETFSENQFEFDKPFLKDFYLKVKQRIQPSHIQICKVDHKPFHEIYEFKKNGFVAAYKFWYDKKMVFKKTEIIAAQTTGLTEEINSLLK